MSALADRAVTGRVVSDAAGLAALEASWRDLYARAPAASPFQSPDWLIPWWRAFSPGTLAVVVAEAGGRLVGLLPAWIEDGPHGVRLLLLGIPVTDHQDALVDPAARSAALDALATAAGALPADRWSLEDLAPGAEAGALPVPPGWTRRLSDQSPSPALDLAGGPDLSGCVPGKRRRQLRRSWLRAVARGAVEIEDAGGDPDGFLDHLLRLHRARWESRGEGGVLSDPRVEAFHREALPRLVAAGLACPRLVRIGGRVAGAYHGLQRGDAAYAYLGGFDPAFEEESPGSILIGAAIADAVAEGRRVFHFLRGAEDYKYRWGARDRFTRRLVAERPGR